MTPQITVADFTAVKEYMASEEVNTPRHSYSNLLTDTIYPTVKSLFEYGYLKAKEKGTRFDIDYLHFVDATRNNPIAVDNVIKQYTPLVNRLIEEYEAEANNESRHILFSTSLGNMTGYQFERYLKEIGLLTK